VQSILKAFVSYNIICFSIIFRDILSSRCGAGKWLGLQKKEVILVFGHGLAIPEASSLL
jgi:hypothetical protein